MSIRIFALSIFSLTVACNLPAKSKLGEYYYGFGYSFIDDSSDLDRQGNFLRLRAHGPNNEESDLGVVLDYGTVDLNSSDGSSLNIGIDLMVHFEDLTGPNSRIHPFVGFGLSYLDEETPIRLAEDGFTWSLFFGSELKVNNSLSAFCGAKIFGLWSEFATNDITLDLGLTWWIDNEHGVIFEYANYLDAELNQFTIKYLYCWQ